MPEPRSVVISDLHVGAGPLDDCDPEVESCLIQFLHELSRNFPVELVINGDFLDFVQASPWQGSELTSESIEGTPLCFTEAQSVKKLRSIVESHRAIFETLSEFVTAHERNTLVILPGNHDADFFWAAVREVFSDALFGATGAGRNRLVFHLEQNYAPRECPTVWIEHGHQHDPANCFIVGDKPCWSRSRPPIFEDQQGQRRLFECTGTRFMIRFMNKLDLNYPFVDNVKPFSRFLKIFGASALQPGLAPLKAAASVWGMMRFLAGSAMKRPTDILTISEASNETSKHPALRLIEDMSKNEQVALVAKLKGSGFATDRPLDMYLRDAERADAFMDFLSQHLDAIEEIDEAKTTTLALSGPAGTLTLTQAYSVDETEALKRAAEKTMRENALDAVIMGHTHESVGRSGRPIYLNTGSWIRYYRFDSDDSTQPWSILKSKAYDLFPYQLQYAEVYPGLPLHVDLKTFRERKR